MNWHPYGMLLFLVFISLLLGICGNTFGFSPLMAFIFELCVCGLVEYLFLLWYQGLCWVDAGKSTEPHIDFSMGADLQTIDF